jgi:hypothetical protein
MGSIPDGVIGISPSICTMALGLTQTNRNEYQEYYMGGRDGHCEGLTTLPRSCGDCLEMWEPQHFGTHRASHRPVEGLLYLYTGVLKIKIMQFF